ncbi:NAD(P)-dependent dehydrogenase, short-chain alcohol dehydrogenase family [Arboricoccus pini]|uniref:NAD(P)-dependent dehydrogenase, short-chain alcohol dehydrogenase family n=1 Tax=Arboricoccus pini TaxID=1963835 RepID=A0A212RYN0_9PROT|nr:glucose 1-dehydrogenase [Arboricoccus pini]SNB77892.1 NAD(P)-dependent dehydrogenase, short-chain alcohol dehydrogenase family [Arboricoccus pini]
MSVLSRFSLKDQHAVITGGYRGIGLAIARAFAEAGASLTLTARNTEGLDAAVATLRDQGHDVDAALMDMRDPSSIEAAADGIIGRRRQVHVLVNNAGIVRRAGILDVSLKDWQEVMDTNLTGLFLASQAFGRHMVAMGGGSIVNIGSNSAIIVDRPQTHGSYNVSKAAMHMLSKIMAAELAPHGVRVNVVAPGYTVTEMTRPAIEAAADAKEWQRQTPLARFADADEIAPAALYLASAASSFVTGEVVVVDGGYTLW